MAITNHLAVLESTGFQQSTMWDFYITDAPETFKFFVIDSTLPFKKLEHETRNTGSKHYTGFTPESEFSITFRETHKFEVYNYFQGWMDEVYDAQKKVFKTGSGKTKTGILAFSKTLLIAVETYNKVFQFNRLRILGIEDKSLDYTTVEGLTLTVNFTVDEVVESNFTTVAKQFNVNVPLVFF